MISSRVMTVLLNWLICILMELQREGSALGCLHLNTIQACKLLFGTVMYGYHTDQNQEEGIYSFNFEAGHRTFVKQWEMAQFTIEKSVHFFE